MREILEYRNARLALEWFDRGPDGHALLAKHPALMHLLNEMGKT